MDQELHRSPRQPDQFDWFSAYINDRGLRGQWRATTFLFTAALGALPLILLGSPTGPDRPLPVAVSVAAAVLSWLGALLWAFRWPTRRQSTWFCVAASASIAGTCLAQSDPYTGLMGCTTFAVIGGFIAYFHSARLAVVNLAVAAVCSAVLTHRLVGVEANWPLAVSALLVVVSLNVGVPFGIQSLAHTLRSDLRSAGHDPLTGLLNRRAFHHAAYELLMSHDTDDTHLVVTVIDLDAFKRLNDSRGHAAGDQALIAVSDVLRETCRPPAVIGRAGGEEFVIADLCLPADREPSAERLRKTIAAIPAGVTASIGTAGIALDSSATTTDPELIENLVDAADAAMYEAKRAGGDQVRHA